MYSLIYIITRIIWTITFITTFGQMKKEHKQNPKKKFSDSTYWTFIILFFVLGFVPVIGEMCFIMYTAQVAGHAMVKWVNT